MKSQPSRPCHVCVARPATTQQHVPAQKAGNMGRVVFSDAFEQSDDGVRVGRGQNGYWRKTLCAPCNNGPCSRSVDAFATLVEAVRVAPSLGDWCVARVAQLELRRVVQEVLTMSLSAHVDVPGPERWPLRRFILDDAARLERLTIRAPRIFLFKNIARCGRVVPRVQLRRVDSAEIFFEGGELSMPPLGVLIADYGGADLARAGFFEITKWARAPASFRGTVTIPLPVLRVEGRIPLMFGTPEQVAKMHDEVVAGYFAENGTEQMGTFGALVAAGTDASPVLPSQKLVHLETDARVEYWMRHGTSRAA